MPNKIRGRKNIRKQMLREQIIRHIMQEKTKEEAEKIADAMLKYYWE